MLRQRVHLLPEHAPGRKILAVIPVLAMVTVAWTLLGHPVPQMDEGIPVVYGDLVLRGAVPHRDFQTLYGPGTPWLVAVAFAALGPGLAIERGIAAVLWLGVVLGLYAFALPWGAWVAVVAALASVLVLGALGLFALAAIGALAFIVLCLVALARIGGNTGAVLGGALAAAAILFRPDYVVAALAPALVLLVGSPRPRWVASAGGLFLGLVPLAAHVILASPTAVFDNLVTDALRAVPSRRLPLPQLGTTDGQLLLVVIAAPLACLLLALVRGGDRRSRDLLAGAVLSLLLLPQLVQRPDAPHLFIAASVAVPLSIVCVAHAVGFVRSSPRDHLRVAAMMVAAAALAANDSLALSIAADSYRSSSPSSIVRRHDRSYPELPSRAAELNALVGAIDDLARPGMRLFVGPQDLTRTNYNDTILYFLFPDLIPASYYLEMEPSTANRIGSRLAADLASADLLALTSRWDGWNEPNDSSLSGSDDAARVVAERFKPVWSGHEYVLYVRR